MIVPDRFWTSGSVILSFIITKGERNNGRGLSYLVVASAAFQIEATQQSVVERSVVMKEKITGSESTVLSGHHRSDLNQSRENPTLCLDTCSRYSWLQQTSACQDPLDCSMPMLVDNTVYHTGSTSVRLSVKLCEHKPLLINALALLALPIGFAFTLILGI